MTSLMYVDQDNNNMLNVNHKQVNFMDITPVKTANATIVSTKMINLFSICTHILINILQFLNFT